LQDNLQKRLDSIRAQAAVGETGPLALASAETEFHTGVQNRLNALIKAQQALGQLEDAVQSPLTLPPETLDSVQNTSSKTEK
jgi:hypothetical protein